MKNVRVYFLLFIASFIFSFSTQLFAHGENELGPNGGFIRMPGAFHTEVVPEKNGLKILLLDINFEHPTIQDSSIKVTIKQKTKKIVLKCKPNVRSYFCPATPKTLARTGKLEVLAMRMNAQGALVAYPLPLRMEEQE